MSLFIKRSAFILVVLPLILSAACVFQGGMPRDEGDAITKKGVVVARISVKKSLIGEVSRPWPSLAEFNPFSGAMKEQRADVLGDDGLEKLVPLGFGKVSRFETKGTKS